MKGRITPGRQEKSHLKDSNTYIDKSEERNYSLYGIVAEFIQSYYLEKLVKGVWDKMSSLKRETAGFRLCLSKYSIPNCTFVFCS